MSKVYESRELTDRGLGGAAMIVGGALLLGFGLAWLTLTVSGPIASPPEDPGLRLRDAGQPVVGADMRAQRSHIEAAWDARAARYAPLPGDPTHARIPLPRAAELLRRRHSGAGGSSP